MRKNPKSNFFIYSGSALSSKASSQALHFWNKLNRLRIPTSRRKTSWLYTSADSPHDENGVFPAEHQLQAPFCVLVNSLNCLAVMWSVEVIRELKKPRRRRQQKPHKFAYLTIKNSIFARFARAFLIFWHFEDLLVLSTTWNDLFCSCVDDVSIWWQMFNFVLLCPKRWFQFNSRMVRTHFSSIMTLNIWKMIAETRSYIFGLRSRYRRRRVCLSSLLLWFWLHVTRLKTSE